MNIFPKGVLFGTILNLASISPRFSITISDLYSSVTKISPTGTSVVDKNALGPIPSPAKWRGNLESLHEILQ